MVLRKSLIATGAVVVALGLGACSSDDSSSSSGSSTPASSAPASSTTTASASAQAGAGATPEELQQTLTVLVDPANRVDDKVAVLANGEARRKNLEALEVALANYKLSFTVADVKTEGSTATGQVGIVAPSGSAPPMPMTWDNVDGKWKLSDASTCALLGMGGQPCA